MTPEQNRARSKAYREANPDKVRAHNLAYYVANREKEIARSRGWQIRNKERHEAYMKIYNAAYRRKRAAELTAYVKNWKKANRDKSRIHERRAKLIRRALMMKAKGRCSFEQFMARATMFGFKCRYCGLALNRDTVTVDHQIPLSRGGTNWPSNVVPACLPCNKRKHTSTVFEYLEKLRHGHYSSIAMTDDLVDHLADFSKATHQVAL